MKDIERGRLVLNSVGNSRGGSGDSSAVFNNPYCFNTEIPWTEDVKNAEEIKETGIYQGRYKINYDTGEIETGSLSTARYEAVKVPGGVNEFYLNRRRILNRNGDKIGSKGDSSVAFTDTTVFKNEKELSETLSEPGDYKIDYENGIVYTYLATGYTEVTAGTSLTENVEKLSSERIHGNIKGTRKFSLDYEFVLNENGTGKADYSDTSVVFQDDKVFGKEFEYVLVSVQDQSSNSVRLLDNDFVRSKREIVVANATGSEGNDFKIGGYGVIIAKEYQTYGDEGNFTDKVLCSLYKNGTQLTETTDYDILYSVTDENLEYGDNLTREFDFNKLGIDDESLTVKFEPYYVDGIKYVSTTGNDTTGDGSENNPWRTIAYATTHTHGVSSAGFFAIVVEDGTYNESSNIDLGFLSLGSTGADRFVHLMARHVGKAVINLSSGARVRFYATDGTTAAGSSHAGIEGFIIRRDSGEWKTGVGVDFRDSSWGSNLLVRNNIIIGHDTGIYNGTTEKNAPIGELRIEHNVVIENNRGIEFTEQRIYTEVTVIIKHNIITLNGYGFVFDNLTDNEIGPQEMTFQYNDIWANGISTINSSLVSPVGFDDTNVDLNPLFVDSTNASFIKRNYRLSEKSRLREQGEEVAGTNKDIGVAYPDYELSRSTGVNAVDQLVFRNPLGNKIRPVCSYNYASGEFTLKGSGILSAGDILEAEYMERLPTDKEPVDPNDVTDSNVDTTNAANIAPQDIEKYIPVDITGEGDPIVQETDTGNLTRENVITAGGYCIDYDRSIVYTTLNPSTNLEVAYKASDPENTGTVGFAYAAEYSTSVDYKYMKESAGTATYTFQEEYDLTNIEIGGVNSTVLNTNQFEIDITKNEGKMLPKASTELGVSYTWQRDVDLVLSNQPVAPTFLDVTVAGANAAGRVTFTGTTVYEGINLAATYTDSGLFTVSIPSGAPLNGRVARVLRIYNATQNYTYDISNYYLNDTVFDSSYHYGGIYGVGVAATYGYEAEHGSLADDQFRIDLTIPGNLTYRPQVSDTFYVDFLWSVAGDSEVLNFITNNRQATIKRFWIVDSISVEKRKRNYDGEVPTIVINSLNEPVEGDTYTVNYEYTAPQEGETITVTYLYNKAVHDVTDAILEKDVKVRDFLIKQAKGVTVNLTASIVLDAIYNDLTPTTGLSIQEEKRILIEERINDYYEDIGIGDTIKEADIIRIIREEEGVVDVVLSLLARDGATGVGDIQLLDNEKLVIGTTNITAAIAEA
jgi:hypothetical protein